MFMQVFIERAWTLPPKCESANLYVAGAYYCESEYRNGWMRVILGRAPDRTPPIPFMEEVDVVAECDTV